MRWLVTGGAGFIGSVLTARLQACGEDVFVVDLVRPDTKIRDYAVGSICDRATFQALPSVQVVIHLAAISGVLPSLKDPVKTVQTNVEGLTRCLDFARHCGASFIFASSGAVAGYRPESPYGASKAAGELLCQAYTHAFAMSSVILRLSSVYGPFSQQKESVVAQFCKRALQGEALLVRGDGQQTRDFVFVEDVVDAFIHAARSAGTVGAGPFGVASERETTVQTIAECIARLASVPVQFVESVTGELRAAPNQTELLPGWASKTSLELGLEQTWKYFTLGGGE